MAAAVAVAVSVAAAVSFTTTPIYESTAQLTFVRQPDIASALSGATSIVSNVEVQLQAQTYAELMGSSEMETRSEEELGQPIPEEVEVTAEYVPDTSVLRISARSSDPALAKNVANAYAIAFERWRRQVTVNQYAAAERIVRDRIERFGDDPQRLTDPVYLQLVSRIQDIRLLRETATGNFVVAAAGELPTEPVLPRHVRDLMLGLMVGIVLGIGAVTLLEQLDVRVHTVDELAEALSLPVLARVPRMGRQAKDGGLVSVSDSSGPLAESFRMLRGNLEFVDIDDKVDSIMVTSCGEGEGKTTTVSNLAIALARAGKRVILADCDLRRPRVHTQFKLINRVGLSTVLAGRSSLGEALQRVHVDTATAGAKPGSLIVLTAGPLPPNPGEIVASRRLADILGEMASHCDLLLIDAPPFLVVGDAAALARSASGIIVVARLNGVTKAMLKEAAEFLRPLPTRKLGLVVTGVASDATGYRYRYYHQPAPQGEDELEADSTPQPLVSA
jgi:receptor protein-tyrosine kinase